LVALLGNVSGMCAGMFFVGCNQPEGPEKENFTGIVFNAQTLDYDGEEHTIEATGLPEGATVEYINAGPFVNAGEYEITIKVTKENYNDYTKTAKLKINKIDFPSSIVFEDRKVMYTGEEKSILIEGDLPEGTSVEYIDNKDTEVGKYEAKAILTNPNYNTKILTATLTIYNIVDMAKAVIDEVLERPDPWSFMPEAFATQNLAVDSSPVLDFTNTVSVANINKKHMGEQMYVLWEGVVNMGEMLEKFDIVYAAGEAIATAYQAFINSNPDNYAEWSGSAAGFNVKIVLNDKQTQMLVGNNLFSIELFADTENNINKGRIDIASGGVLNYEMKDDYLKFNVALTIKGVMSMKQIEFVRNEDVVTGYFYEYLGLESVAVKTSAVISFNEEFAIVMSAKRDATKDLIIDGYEEVYSATTGQLLGCKVLESIGIDEYETYWVNIYDVSGISSVKAVENGSILPNKNSHDVYINGLTTVFEPKYNTKMGGLVKTSRHFDIEMKTVYYVQEVVDGDKIKYEVIETQIPMLFIQRENVADFGDEAKEMNPTAFLTNPTLPNAKISVVEADFESLKEILDLIKEELTYQELVNHIGQKNPFFSTVS